MGLERTADCGVEPFFVSHLRAGVTIFQFVHILRILKCREVDCSRGSASVSSFAEGERSKTGSAPRGRHCRMRPSSFTSQPNLNLTMEPAQYACNPIHGPRLCRAARIFGLLAQKVFQRVIEKRMNGLGGGFSAPLARRCAHGVRTWKKNTIYSLSFIIVAPPVSVASTWP